MSADAVTKACAVVAAYLERSMVPDPEGAAAYVADGVKIIFTGGRDFTAPADTAAFNAKRYRWVKKSLGQMHAAVDAASGDIHVFNTGHLYGAWPDGTAFDGNRYIDTFVVREGMIVETQVWNDSAEWLLDRAGLSEAPL
ncbi:MAG: nuclear transport factor 2 family protein [Tateyamaria sp.]|uniref:nuclear transport factor 2 family protein n=1 Tax=Tateyamaria sp. TaxID=1929288 RepID=UPI00326FF568